MPISGANVYNQEILGSLIGSIGNREAVLKT